MNNGIKVYTPDTLSKRQEELPDTRPIAVESIDAAREVAEVQAAMVIAQSMPRDEVQVWAAMKRACRRKVLAEKAVYAYPRGGQMVEGPSIRLAEELARCFRNIKYGLKEVGRRSGESDVIAFAWDLENNVSVERRFVVRHGRDTKGGFAVVEAERDKYEVIANYGQRRVRAAILEILPGDLVDEALVEVRKTLASGDGRPIADRVRDMVLSFGELGVPREAIEGYLGHPISAVVDAELPRLRSLYNSIQSGMLKAHEVFSAPPKVAEPPAEKVDKDTGEVTTQAEEKPAVAEPGPPSQLTPEEVAEYQDAERAEREAIAAEGGAQTELLPGQQGKAKGRQNGTGGRRQ